MPSPAAFNRTYLELKLESGHKTKEGYKAFNRTYLELKLCSMLEIPKWEHAFNRTYLELKHEKWEDFDERVTDF